MNTELPRNYLAAAAVFMADKDVRHYLKGVFIEALPAETRMTATDGAIAGVLRHKRENGERFEVIVPAAIVALVAKLPSEFVSLKCEGGKWSLGGVPFEPVDGKFPDYRRVVPANCNGAAGHYDPDLIARFSKAGKALKRKDSPIIRQSGEHSALVHFYAFDDFVGVLMPMRMFTEKMPDLGTPAWGAERV